MSTLLKNNHFVDLVKYIEKNETVLAPVPLPDADEDDNIQEENQEKASFRSYQKLLKKQNKGTLNYNEGGLLTFLKQKFKS